MNAFTSVYLAVSPDLRIIPFSAVIITLGRAVSFSVASIFSTNVLTRTGGECLIVTPCCSIRDSI